MKAIVIGGNHHNTLGVIRSLGRKGVQSFVILHSHLKNNYILKSRYIDGYVVVDSEDTLIGALVSLRAEDKKQIVICSSDLAASIIDRHRDSLSTYFYLPGCAEQGFLTKLMNKQTMSKIAEDCGLLVPKSFVIDKQAPVYSDIIFPCITKPISSIEGRKTDVTICNNKEELMQFINQSPSKVFQVQQYIQKKMEYQLIGVAKGELLIPGRSRIITQPLVTNTGFLHYEKLEGNEPINCCKDFINRVGYCGLFSAEFIRGEDNLDYFLEFNFRNDGNSICVTEAGVNLPYIWCQLCTDSEFSIQSVNTNIREIYVMPEFDEIKLWYSRKIGFSRMIRELCNADVYMEYASDDPKPTNGKLGLLMHLLSAIVKRPIRVCLNLIKTLK